MQSIVDLLRVWADIWEWRRVSQSILPSACAAGGGYTEYGEVGEMCLGLWKRSKILAMGTSIPGSGWEEEQQVDHCSDGVKPLQGLLGQQNIGVGWKSRDAACKAQLRARHWEKESQAHS